MTGDLEGRPALGLRTPRAVRILLLVVTAFPLLSGVLLFLLPEHTDRYFSWTITPPLTAAFMGASSLAAAALVWLSARQTWWVQARPGLLSPWVFLVTLTIVTFVHLDRFHFDAPLVTAQISAWVWMAFYLGAPLWILVVVVPILHRRVPDPPRVRPLPGWFRPLLVLQGLPVGLVGVLLLAMTERPADAWPWALTPLTARAVGCWMIANAVLVLHVAAENDLDRMLPAAVTWVVSGSLQLVALVRYRDDFEAASSGGLPYLVFATSLLAFGILTLWLRRRVVPVGSR